MGRGMWPEWWPILLPEILPEFLPGLPGLPILRCWLPAMGEPAVETAPEGTACRKVRLRGLEFGKVGFDGWPERLPEILPESFPESLPGLPEGLPGPVGESAWEG